MPSLPPRPTRLSVTELPFYVFLVTLGLCLFRAADLPSLDFGVGGTTLSIGPADPALLVTAVLAVRRALAPPPGSLALAARGDRRLRRAHRPQRDPELRPAPSRRRASCPTSPSWRSEPPRSSTRASDSPTSPGSWSPSAPWPSRGARSSSWSTAASARDRSWASTTSRRSRPWRSCSGSRTLFDRDRRPPTVGARRDRRRGRRDRPRRVAGERARPLSRRGGDGGARARAPRPAPPRRRRHGADLRRGDGRDATACAAPTSASSSPGSGRRPEHAGPVRRELEPAPDLRLRRRPRLSRPSGPRHRLGGRAAAARLRAVSRRTRASASPTNRRTTSRRRQAR